MFVCLYVRVYARIFAYIRHFWFVGVTWHRVVGRQVMLGATLALSLMTVISVVLGRIFRKVPAQLNTSKSSEIGNPKANPISYPDAESDSESGSGSGLGVAFVP